MIAFHKSMGAHLVSVWRGKNNIVLYWLRTIDKSTVVDLRKKKMYLETLFLETVRSFLSMQASLASSMRLFGDSGYQEIALRLTFDSSVTEMPIFIPAICARA